MGLLWEEADILFGRGRGLGEEENNEFADEDWDFSESDKDILNIANSE